MTPTRTSTGRDLILGSISEREWQRQVITWAKREGWKVYSIHDSRTQEWGTDPGFPDLVLVRGDRLLFVELKAQSGRLRPSQTGWRIALEAVPCVEWHAWRPSDEATVKHALRGQDPSC